MSTPFELGRAFSLGLSFKKGMESKQGLALDEKRWITIKGTHVLIDDESGQILSGAIKDDLIRWRPKDNPYRDPKDTEGLDGEPETKSKPKKKSKAKAKPKLTPTAVAKPVPSKTPTATPKASSGRKVSYEKKPISARVAEDNRTFAQVKKSLESKGITFDSSFTRSRLDPNLRISNIKALDHLMDDFGVKALNEAQNLHNTIPIKLMAVDAEYGDNFTGRTGVGNLYAWGFNPYINFELEKGFYSDEEQNRGSTLMSILSGWHTPVDSSSLSIYTTTHEFGHLLAHFMTLRRQNYSDFYSYRQAYYDLNEDFKNAALKVARKEAKKEGYNLSDEELTKRYVSRYGHQNSAEFFAEAFTNAVSGKPSVVGKEILKLLKKELKC